MVCLVNIKGLKMLSVFKKSENLVGWVWNIPEGHLMVATLSLDKVRFLY